MYCIYKYEIIWSIAKTSSVPWVGSSAPTKKGTFFGYFQSPNLASSKTRLRKQCKKVGNGRRWQIDQVKYGQIGPSKVEKGKLFDQFLCLKKPQSVCFPPGGLMPQMVALSNFLKRGGQGSHTIPRVEDWNQCLHVFASSSSANGPKHSQFLCWMSPPGLIDPVWIQPIFTHQWMWIIELINAPPMILASFYAMQNVELQTFRNVSIIVQG